LCQYEYTGNYKRQRKGLGNRCTSAELFDKSSLRKEAETSLLKLPIDAHGCCIFHSSETKWKLANNFKQYFLKLIRLTDNSEDKEYYDFAEFIFVGEDKSIRGKKDYQSLNIQHLIFHKPTCFNGAKFKHSTAFDHVNFSKGAGFENASFYGDLTIVNSRFKGADFRNVHFSGRTSFTKNEFVSYTLFSESCFSGDDPGYVAKFEGSVFHEITDFSKMIFEPKGRESSMGFLDVKFDNIVDFTNAEFHNQILFRNVCFTSTTDFVDTQFCTSKSAVRYRSAAVEFQRLEVAEGATLSFLSTDKQRKMFNHDVKLSFAKTPEGSIRFENVNFNNFDPDSKVSLMQLSKLGKVEIGSGCIKYRVQTEVRCLAMSSDNMTLMLELCQTFSNYFTVNNGHNLGFEIVERNDRQICFFYFSDEDITIDVFLEQLAKTEQSLWNLLSAKGHDSLIVSDTALDEDTSDQLKSTVINTVDGVSALIGTFFRVAARIACGSWNQKDTANLLGVISFNLDGTERRAVSLHSAIVANYVGNTLMDLNRRQNAVLPEISKTSRLSIASSVNIHQHYFSVALSFPIEHREYVEPIAQEIVREMGPHSCFYYNDYKAQCATPNLDILLQDIYRNRSQLVVVFLSQKYQEKKWSGLEFRAIREIIMEKEEGKIMFIKMDEGSVEGVFSTDGYIDGRSHTPNEVAQFILERVTLQ